MPETPDNIISADHELDTRGLFCPEPLMLLHNQVRDMGAGETVRVLATDPSSQRDIPKFCSFLGHTLLAQETEQGNSTEIFTYLIQKRGDR